jgi:hypothetical protein
MSQDSHISALRPIPIVSRALLSSEVIEIRNCLQVLLCLEYTLEQSRVVGDNVRKIDGLLRRATISSATHELGPRDIPVPSATREVLDS